MHVIISGRTVGLYTMQVARPQSVEIYSACTVPRCSKLIYIIRPIS